MRARGAKPHSLHHTNNRPMCVAKRRSSMKMHPQERQQSGGAARRGTECSPETGLKGRPQESQRSAAVRRETESSAPGEGHRMFLREGSSLDGQAARQREPSPRTKHEAARPNALRRCFPTVTKPDSNREQAGTIPLCSFSERMRERFEVPGIAIVKNAPAGAPAKRRRSRARDRVQPRDRPERAPAGVSA